MKKIKMGVFFDGTGKNMYNDSRDISESNIVKLYKGSIYDFKKYISGVGADRKITSDEWEEIEQNHKKKKDFYNKYQMATGDGMAEKAEKGLSFVKNVVSKYPKNEKIVDSYGFSRGAAIARFFVNKVNKYIRTNKIKNLQVGFLGIFDTVESAKFFNDVNDNMNDTSYKRAFHITAKDEKRDLFPLSSLKDKNGKISLNAKEISTIGVHSDIGGGYAYESYDNKNNLKYSIERDKKEYKCFQDKGDLYKYAKKNDYKISKKIDKIDLKFISYYCAWMIKEHKVYDGLSNVYLMLMIEEAKKSGVEFKTNFILNTNFKIKHTPKLKKYLELLENNKKIPNRLKQYISNNYVHNSSIKEDYVDWIANKDWDGKRDVIYNNPNKAENPKYKRNSIVFNINNRKIHINDKILYNFININLENKAQKLHKRLGLRYIKPPMMQHNPHLPQQIEGMYKSDSLTLRKNPRVSDKKAEAVAMHEIFHHTQKDSGLPIEQEEAIANQIEKAYLNENQPVNNQEIDFDLIYAHTIKQFYNHDKLVELVKALGGDTLSAKRIYSNAMRIISENATGKDEIKKTYGFVKKAGSSGVKYKHRDYKASFADGAIDWISDFFSDDNLENDMYYSDPVAGVRG